MPHTKIRRDPFQGKYTKSLSEVSDISNPNFVGTAALLSLAGSLAMKGIDALVKRKQDKKQAVVDEENRVKAAKATTNARLSTQVSGGGQITSAGGFVNPYASVNPMAAGGIAVTDDYQEFNGGGSHENHPMGGIPIGMGNNGKMNTVEEGETATTVKVNGKETKMVFTDRGIVDDNNTLPKFLTGMTYAAAHKKLNKMFEERTDKYSRNTKNSMIERLALSQLEVNKNQEDTNQSKYGTNVNQLYGGSGPEIYVDNTGREWDELAKSVYEVTAEDIEHDRLSDQLESSGEILLDINHGVPKIATKKSTQPDINEDNYDDYRKSYKHALNTDLPKTYDEFIGKKGSFFNRADDWVGKHENAIEGISAGIGALTQTAGIVSNIIGRKKLKTEGYDTVKAYTVGKGDINPYLVNRQSIQREIANTAATARRGALDSSGGNLGIYASQTAATNAASLKAVSQAMLGAEIADAQEKARVQSIGVGIDQFNAQQQAAADEATARNKGAWDTQMGLYDQGIASNISSIGQSLMNYAIASNSSRHMGNAATLDAAREK